MSIILRIARDSENASHVGKIEKAYLILIKNFEDNLGLESKRRTLQA
jgi:hypothetical protein